MHLDKNKIFLKPRFKLQVNLSQKAVLKKFRNAWNKPSNKFISKIANNHVVFDIPKKDNHIWSPQLHLEVLDDINESALLKGLFGPKPNVWTFFIFVHFLIAFAFFIFLVIAYTQYSLDKNYELYFALTLLMPVIWITLYIIGQLGKRKGHNQMEKIFNFLMKTLNEETKIKKE